MLEVPIGLIILLAVLVLLSAFFSSAETAFSSVNKIRLRNYAGENRPGSKKALYISDNFDNALSTILVGNNIVNIAAASISSKVAIDLFGPSTGLLVSTFGMTLLILIFGEILPKSIAKEHAEAYTLKISGILLLLIRILAPVNYLFGKLKRVVSRTFSSKEGQMPSVTEEEIKVMIDISEEEGTINKHERELVHRSLDFNEVTVGEALTHRTDMIAVDIDHSVEDIKQVFLRERYSRIPVYRGSIDHIVGFLSERDFFAVLLKGEAVDMEKLMRKPMFVVKSMKIAALLPELQRTKSHMAVVIDEYGGTAGLITLEDILEELVGDIWDEHDEKTSFLTEIGGDAYLLDGSYELEDFAELFDIAVPDGASRYVGEWIFRRLERIPAEGEIFRYEHLTITLMEVSNHRIRKVKVERTPAAELENQV